MQTTAQDLAKVETDNAISQIELEIANQTNDGSNIRHNDKPGKQAIEYKYTDILLNAPPSLNCARAVILMVFFVIGSVSSYQYSVILELQEKKATFRDQAIFTISAYPFIFKVIFAPFVDLYYFEKVGKCKTWMIGSASFLSALLIFVSPFAESFIDPNKIAGLTTLWFCINLVSCFLAISAEMFIVKIFEEDDKSKGSMLLDLGWSIGGFFSYNLFVPLNSVNWMNKYVFTTTPITEPIVSHKAMVFCLAVIAFIYALVLLIFVGEKKKEIHQVKLSLPTLLGKVCKMFTNPIMGKFLIYIALMRIFKNLVVDTIVLKTMNAGITKTTIVNIDTVTFPLYVVASVCFMRLMTKGKVMKLYSWMLVYGIIVIVFSLLVLDDLEANRNITRTTVFLVLISILGKFCVDGPFLMGYINLITPDDIGSTFITFMMCWQNMTMVFPSSIGLEIIHQDVFNFNLYAGTCLVIQLALIFGYMRYSNSLDEKDKDE